MLHVPSAHGNIFETYLLSKRVLLYNHCNMTEATDIIQPKAETDNPTTKFGRALVSFAQKFDELANRETNVTHKQMWLALGTEAVVGATAVALIGSGGNTDINPYNAYHSFYKLMAGNHPHPPINTVEYVNWVDSWWGAQGMDYNMKVKDLAERITGTLAGSDPSRSILSPEKVEEINSYLRNLNRLEGIRDQTRDVVLLAGVGSIFAAWLQNKASEKVKISAPTGKIPAVLPMIASTMRSLSKLF